MTNLNSPQEVDDQNNKSLLSLAWEIENSQGKFQVMLAHCNYGNLRESMKQELQKICSI